MLCEKCGKNEATVHYTETVNGKTTKYVLCHDCAEQMKKESGFFSSGGFEGAISEMFSDMFSPFMQRSARQRGDSMLTEEKKCPVCGATLHDISRERKVGCPECYRTFKKELAYTIERIHGGQKYKSDTQANGASAVQNNTSASPVDAELVSLKQKLSDAVKSENFEEAAKLRDMIHEHEDKNNSDTKKEDM